MLTVVFFASVLATDGTMVLFLTAAGRDRMVPAGRGKEGAFSIDENSRAVHAMRRVFLAAMRWPRYVRGKRAGDGGGRSRVRDGRPFWMIVKRGRPILGTRQTRNQSAVVHKNGWMP